MTSGAVASGSTTAAAAPTAPATAAGASGGSRASASGFEIRASSSTAPASHVGPGRVRPGSRPGDGCRLLVDLFQHDRARVLVIPHAEVHRVAQPVLVGPLREPHLDDEIGLHPLGVGLLGPGRWG